MIRRFYIYLHLRLCLSVKYILHFISDWFYYLYIIFSKLVHYRRLEVCAIYQIFYLSCTRKLRLSYGKDIIFSYRCTVSIYSLYRMIINNDSYLRISNFRTCRATIREIFALPWKQPSNSLCRYRQTQLGRRRPIDCNEFPRRDENPVSGRAIGCDRMWKRRRWPSYSTWTRLGCKRSKELFRCSSADKMDERKGYERENTRRIRAPCTRPSVLLKRWSSS